MSRPGPSPSPRPPRSGSPASRAAAFLDHYRTRLLTCVAATLALMLVLVHLPVDTIGPRVGWRAGHQYDPITIADVQESAAPEKEKTAESRPPEDAPIPTDQRRVVQESSPAPTNGTDESGTEETSASESTSSTPDRTIARMATLNPSDQPEIVGGRGALYMHVIYPPEAARRGIQGRVLLKFIVDTEGQPTDIEVTQSVHPLCDSAAVRALRSVRFAPAKRNGERVPVLMRLPIRFTLETPAPDSTHTADARQDDATG